jgi:hypothetical protein
VQSNENDVILGEGQVDDFFMQDNAMSSDDEAPAQNGIATEAMA